MRRTTKGLLAAVAVVALAAPMVSPAQAAFKPRPWDPQTEVQNFSKTFERARTYLTPGYQLLLRYWSARNAIAAHLMAVNDPQREFLDHLCRSGDDGCAGDVRLYDWQTSGYGQVQPVFFTARNGATISGHVWATRSGPASRPGIVITNGSVQADEQMYWYAAQALAKAGYVVLTFDPQGQGQSDTFGEGADQQEGFPAQSDGRPFFDGTEDAINFFLSTPEQPYVPVRSCSSGTSHAAKQDARVSAGLDNAFNPFWSVLDRSKLGLAGHSYGAAGVSYIGQWDPRVKAIVAWDNLALPDPNAASGSTGQPREQPCPSDPHARAVVPITKPALGISADYGLPPQPNTSAPDPTAKDAVSMQYSRAGVDSGELVIRGGSHLDFSYIPNPAFGASARGPDLIAWYTTAWFDKYVAGFAGSDARLLTTRWRNDLVEAAIDPTGDGNAFSFWIQSRVDVHLGDGSVFDCEDMRAGCAGMRASDGWGRTYSYLAIATTRDVGPFVAGAPRGTGIYAKTAELPAPVG